MCLLAGAGVPNWSLGSCRVFGERGDIPVYNGEQDAVAVPGWNFSNVYENTLTRSHLDVPVSLEVNTTWYFRITVR